MSDNTITPWDRRPGEPNLWYQRFERFRLAGPARSIRQVFLAERAGRQKAPKGATPERVPSAWDRAAAAWRWAERAEAWDEQQAELRRRAAAEALRAEIERHRANGRLLYQGALAIAVKMLQHARDRLDAMTAKEVAQMAPREVAAVARAAARVAEAALNGEAVSLGTAEILRALEPS